MIEAASKTVPAAVTHEFSARGERTKIKAGNVVARLAVWEHPALAGDVAAEFSGVLDQLRREVRRDETERLLNKERLSGLTPAEKAELKRLLAERHSRDSV